MPLSLTTRRKLISVAIAMAIFAALGAVTTAAVGRPVEIGTTNAVLIGLGVGLFEEFYVQSTRGNWLRAMHPLRSIPVYVLVVIVLYFVAVHISHLLLNRLDDLPVVYRRLPYGLTFFTLFSIVGILMMRVVHFIGPDTLFHLVVGTYHRPVAERKILLFLDINGSTALSERLGGLQMRALVRKFLSDVARPIVDHGGDIYLYKGDGLIAIWDWDAAVRDEAILRAVDGMFATVTQERDTYVRSFSAAGISHRYSRRRRCGERAGRHQTLDWYLWRYYQYRGPDGGSCSVAWRALRDIARGLRCTRGARPLRGTW
jgi:adenylate cyclase